MSSGHVRKRTTKAGGTVWGVIVNRDRDPVTGNRRRTAHGSYPTKTEAVRELRRVLTEMDAGTYIERTDVSTGDYMVNLWLPAHRLVVRANTAANYEMVIRAHIVPALGNIRLQKLTAPMLTAFYGRLVEGDGPTGRPLRAKSVRNLHVIVHKALKDAVAWGYLVRNPADAAKAPRQGRSKKHSIWTADEVRRFLDHVGGTEFEALYTVSATTGARRGDRTEPVVFGIEIVGAPLTRTTVCTIDSSARSKSMSHHRRPNTQAPSTFSANIVSPQYNTASPQAGLSIMTV